MHYPPCNGKCTRQEIQTSFKKSFDNKPAMPETLAPSTLRIPISFVLRSAVYAARPNKPRHEMMMASAANTRDNLLISVSLKNILIELIIYKHVIERISRIIFLHYCFNLRQVPVLYSPVVLCAHTLLLYFQEPYIQTIQDRVCHTYCHTHNHLQHQQLLQ